MTETARLTPAMAWARRAAARLLARHGLTHWEFGFNTNVRRAGVCFYPQRPAPGRPGRPGRIEMSAHYVNRNARADVLDTLLHELAHALVGPGHGHDAVWRAKCREVGARPERCYDPARVDMPKGRWRARCGGCRREFDRHRRPTAGRYCAACGPAAGRLAWALAESD